METMISIAVGLGFGMVLVMAYMLDFYLFGPDKNRPESLWQAIVFIFSPKGEHFWFLLGLMLFTGGITHVCLSIGTSRVVFSIISVLLGLLIMVAALSSSSRSDTEDSLPGDYGWQYRRGPR